MRVLSRRFRRRSLLEDEAIRSHVIEAPQGHEVLEILQMKATRS